MYVIWDQGFNRVCYHADALTVSHIYGLYVCALMGPWLGCYIGLMHSFDMETFCKVFDIRGTPLPYG